VAVEIGDDRLPARFWSKVRVAGDCWIWTGALNHGYGYFRWDGRTQNAHRVAYQELVAPIAGGHDVDHLCHGRDAACPGGHGCPHRACVNPEHLEPVPPKTNMLRGRSPFAIHAGTTHCPMGHALTGENLWLDRGARICRTCKLAQNAAYKEANRERVRTADRAYRARRRAEAAT
jgi:hypothetical protein